MANAPVELKVKVGAVAATLTALLLGGIAAVLPGGVVPAWVSTPVLAIVTGAVTLGLAWLAKHTPRNVIDITGDDTVTPVVIPPPTGPTPQS